jgi:proteasome assembly chaperone (PAC2) family protein
MRSPLKFPGHSGHQNTSLIVGWGSDAGKLGESVVDFIIEKLGGQQFYEIGPEEYFTLGGVTIEDDLVQFPESRFYICPRHDLVIFKSTPPVFEIYQFLNRVLDFAEQECKVKNIYTIGGMVSLNTHTAPRKMLGTFSSAEVKEELSAYEIDSNADFETPPGQKPTLNIFLLWVSRKRHLNGVNLWMPVPFYLMAVDDPKSQKQMLEFLNHRFNLGIDLSSFDQATIKQNMKLNQIRNLYPDIDDYMTRLEGNLTLSEDENIKLVEQVEEHLKSN